jgi:predicted transcriptional regulator
MRTTKTNGKRSLKEQVIAMVQSLPDDCSVEDIQYHLYVREKVLRGIHAIEKGDFITQEEVEKQSSRWLKSAGRNRRSRISEKL